MSPLAVLLRRHHAPPPPEPPDPVPEGWMVLETRWDCSHCHGVQAAVVHENSFRCLRCDNEIAALTD